MKTTTFVLLALLAIPIPASAVAPPLPPDVTVTLQIDATAYPLIPESKTCVVSVPEGSDGKVMLTAATASGCIAGWTATYSATVGAFFLDGVDGRRALCDTPLWLVHCTYWNLGVNGVSSSTGIDGWSAAEGDSYSFTYDRSFAALPIP